jgi:hypothetical protein
MDMKMKYIGLPLTFLAAASCGESKKEQGKQPNIILIMTDDHTRQAMGCYGGVIETPNLDRIAAEGIRMDNFYVPNAISGPSRACILTGKYSHKNGFTDNSKTFDGDQQTFPKLLQKAGYQTAMIGKWHLNSDPQGFDYWSILKGQGEYYSPLFIENGVERIDSGYVTDIITDKAIDFLKNRDKKKPFAMLYYHKAPHRNWMPAQRHLGYYDDHIFPEPDNLFDDYSGRGRAAKEQEMSIAKNLWPQWDLKVMTEEEFGKSYAELEDTGNANMDDVKRANDQGNSYSQMKGAYERMNKEERKHWNEAYAQRIAEYKSMQGRVSEEEMTSWKYQQYMKDYCAVVKGVDENVGRLLDYLKSIGELDNTLIIYTSDQGFYLGEHGWFDKRFMYEESFTSPMLMRLPGAIKAGRTSKAFAMNIDLAPTILDYAGVEIPSDIQGRSLRPVVENEGKAPEGWRTAVYYHYYEYPSWHSVKRHYGIRTERYKLIHFYNDVDEWELYDLKKDPKEMKSVYDDPEYASVRDSMHKQLEQLQIEVEDTENF